MFQPAYINLYKTGKLLERIARYARDGSRSTGLKTKWVYARWEGCRRFQVIIHISVKNYLWSARMVLERSLLLLVIWGVFFAKIMILVILEKGMRFLWNDSHR